MSETYLYLSGWKSQLNISLGALVLSMKLTWDACDDNPLRLQKRKIPLWGANLLLDLDRGEEYISRGDELFINFLQAVPWCTPVHSGTPNLVHPSAPWMGQ